MTILIRFVSSVQSEEFNFAPGEGERFLAAWAHYLSGADTVRGDRYSTVPNVNLAARVGAHINPRHGADTSLSFAHILSVTVPTATPAD